MESPDTYEDDVYVYSKIPPTFFDRLLKRFGFTPPDRGYSQRQKRGWCGVPYISEIETIEEHIFKLGKTVSGEDVFLDLNKTPQVLIGGTTGSGKSNLLHLIVLKMLTERYHSLWQFVFIDPKCVEFGIYRDMPCLFAPLVEYKIDEAVATLEKVVAEIKRREKDIDENPGTWHKQIFVAVDEFSDLMSQAPKEIEEAILTIAHDGPKFGVYLAIATSRPSDEIFSEHIRNAIPTRIAGNLSSSADSVRVLGVSGAEKLLGKGDMLYISKDMVAPIRFQAPLVPEKELVRIAKEFR